MATKKVQTNIHIAITVGSRTRQFTFHSQGRADQWVRKAVRLGTPDSAKVVTTRGREVQRTTLGAHPVTKAFREEIEFESAAA